MIWQRVEQSDRHRERSATAKRPQNILHRTFLMPGDFGRRFAIINRGRPYRDSRRRWSHRRQQSRSEREHLVARTGGPFRKQRDGLRPFKLPGNSFGLKTGSSPIFAADIKCVVLIREPVDPSGTEVVLGNKRAAGRAGKHEDVEPAHVVGDQKSVRSSGRSCDDDPSAANPAGAGQESAGPARPSDGQPASQMQR